MKRILFAVAVVAIGLVAGNADAQGFTPDPKMNYKVLAFRSVETGRLEGVVASVDPAGRKVAIKGPSGTVRTVRTGKNIQGLEKINVEDGIVAETYRSATFVTEKGGQAALQSEVVAAFESASRSNQVVEAGEVVAEGTATVASIDKAAKTVTFTGPEGRAFPVRVENPVLLDGVSVGQKVDYRIVDAVAIDVKVTPKPAPAPPPPATKHAKVEGKKIVIDDVIFFQTNKDVIQEKSYEILNDVATVMKANPNINVRVEGHASKDPKSAARGKAGAEFNLKLSDLRAKAVKAYLVEKGGIAPERLEAVGFGWNQPIATNDTKEGRYKNQRVDFVITN
ncbi:MAG TPA: OmpA family protein [Anaeromyxobacteraceae bacterium]|nr:OmpA family protein [Anaeromyxobacteraceae bacterium]